VAQRHSWPHRTPGRRVHDLRLSIHLGNLRAPQPNAKIIDGHTRQTTPVRKGRAGWEVPTWGKNAKAVDPLGEVPAIKVRTPNSNDQPQIGTVLTAENAVTGEQRRWWLSIRAIRAAILRGGNCRER
jgi:hypothetical protein